MATKITCDRCKKVIEKRTTGIAVTNGDFNFQVIIETKADFCEECVIYCINHKNKPVVWRCAICKRTDCRCYDRVKR